ncbi:MAG: MFS transporter [Verrucomicrobiota bacterium]
MTDEPTHSVPGKIRIALSHGPFMRYMAGEAVSMTGTWMQVMAQNWVMTYLTTSAMVLGMVNFAAGIPMIAFSMIGGVCADRYDRRGILLATQVVQIILALLAGWLVASGRIQIWHVVVIAAIIGVSNSFEMPAASALVPELVPKEHLATAIAIDRSVFHGTRLIGPAVAGYVIGLWGTASAFYLNAFSFVALMAALFSLPPRLPGTAEEESRRRGGIKEGIQYARSDKPTLAMIALIGSITVFVFPVMVVMLPLYARNVLHLGAHHMGLLMGVSAFGSFAGSITLLTVPRHTRCRLMMVAVVGVVVAMISLALAHRFAVAGAALILQSLGVSTLIGIANTIVQERAPNALRGRVSALVGLSFFGLMPFASLGITSLADWVGMRESLLIAAGLYAAVSIPVLIGSRKRICEESGKNAESPNAEPGK